MGRSAWPGFRGGRALIQEPSGGDVLSAIGPEAVAEPRDLRQALVGRGRVTCVLGAAGKPAGRSYSAAELFTASPRVGWPARSGRL